MSSRDRDTRRHYLSGSAKRKAKEEKDKKIEKVLSKTPKVSNFFHVQSGVVESAEIETVNTESDLVTPVTSNLSIEETLNPSEFAISRSTTIITEESKKYSTDIGEWPSNVAREYWIAKGSSELQHINSNFLSSKKFYEKETTARFCQKSFFSYKHKLSNETYSRDWLCYSEMKGRLFCFVCKLTRSDNDSSRLTKEGLDDWKNVNILLKRHEESLAHRQAIISLLSLKSKSQRVDYELVRQMETEQDYWRLLLKRIIAVVQFLAERGLAFRGSDEVIGSTHNGNYLGILELIAKFDDFMAQHIQTFGSKGKGNTSYLSKTTCDEFIQLIASSLLDKIITEIKSCKYYSVSLDSTPDISHVDQFTLIIRYVLPSGPVERFIKFLDMEGHTAEQLTKSLLEFLSEHSIDINNCRGQRYDNASNMSGRYCGVQARIKEINQFAEYIPCLAHSLNLVAKCAADCCTESIIFFSFIENLYTFFSASTYRWDLLMKTLKNNDKKIPVLKRLSDTRWSARADATKALVCGFSQIKEILEDISENLDQKAECRNQAYGLAVKMSRLETGIMAIFWNEILERFQATSTSLQSSNQDLNTGYSLYKSLHGYVQAIRSTFSDFEQKAKVMTVCAEYHTSKRGKRNKKYDHFSGSTTLDEIVENQTPRQVFEYQVFIVIIDNILSALTERMKAYNRLAEMFGVFRQLKSLAVEDILNKSSIIVSYYKQDVEESLGAELVHFAELLKSDVARVIDSEKQDCLELQFYKLLKDNSLESCFPNVEIILRIFLSIMVTNCSGERSFSTLKRIKNILRNTMGQERLNHLTLMCVESALLRELDVENVITKFAQIKSRKHFF